MKILVTGGTGFLGKNIQKSFLPYSQNNEIRYFGQDLNLCNSAFSAQILNFQPDVIVHLAAKCGGILANKNAPAEYLIDNLKMGISIYEQGLRQKVKRIYSIGSACQYPLECPIPFHENNIWNGPMLKTNFPYGQAKNTLMMISQTYREQYGIGGAFLILANLYGKHDNFDLVNSHVVPALINKFVDAVDKKLPTVECWGSGIAVRELLYAEDASEAIVKAVINDLDTELPINLGTGSCISIKDLAYLIGNITNFTGEIIFTDEVSDGQLVRQLDSSRAKKILDWEAKTQLADGLHKTVQWYKNNK